MKILTNTKMAKIGLILGGASCALLLSNCAMSQKKSGETGAGLGAVGGAIIGGVLGKQHGKGKGDVVKGAILGGVAGGVAGEEVGKKTSILKGIEDVRILPF